MGIGSSGGQKNLRMEEDPATPVRRNQTEICQSQDSHNSNNSDEDSIDPDPTFL
jgi:hypothetical protein